MGKVVADDIKKILVGHKNQLELRTQHFSEAKSLLEAQKIDVSGFQQLIDVAFDKYLSSAEIMEYNRLLEERNQNLEVKATFLELYSELWFPEHIKH